MTYPKNDAGLYEAQIDGALYEFGKWSAQDSTETLADLFGIVGASVGPAIVNGFLDGQDSAQLRREALEKTLGQLAAQMTTNRAVVMRLIKRLATHNVTCNGKRIEFQVHYQERLLHMFKVVWAALEVQFGDFFGGLADMLKGLLGPTPAIGTSTGSSGDP